MLFKFPFYCAVCGAILLASLAATSRTSVAAPLPTLTVPVVVSAAPRVDATDDDTAWQKAALIPALSVSTGAQGTPLPTQIRALWDENFLYLRFDCEDADIYTPFASPDRDQELFRGDVVEVFLDVVGDGKQVFEFQFSPGGQVFDQNILLTTEPRSDENFKLLPEVLERDFWPVPAWNCAGLRSATARTPQGWRVDVAFPAKPLLRRLGQKNWSAGRLRLNLMRYDWAKTGQTRELLPMNWAPVLSGCPHISPGAMGVVILAPRVGE